MLDVDSRNAAMSDTVKAYITQLKAIGFVPNAKASTHKRDLGEVDEPLLKRASAPDIKTVLSLLIGHGFQPVSGKTSRDINDDLDSPSLAKRALGYMVKRAIMLLPERAMGALAKRAATSLNKRTIPDIGLVVSLLEAEGFYPSGVKTTKRSLPEQDEALEIAKRQSAGDINSVINQLMVYGYDPTDFGPTASKLISSFLSQLPASKTAICPQNNNTLYSIGGDTYELICGVGFGGNDLPAVPATSFAACLASCSSYVPPANIVNAPKCVAASWLIVNGEPNNCHRKFAVADITYGSSITNGRAAGRIIAR